MYVACCLVSVLSTHAESYSMLFLGRVAGGVATSLLFSVPESWLVSEFSVATAPLGAAAAAGARRFEESWLGELFGWMYFGDGMVAIFAGLVAGGAASTLGPTGACLASAVLWRSIA